MRKAILSVTAMLSLCLGNILCIDAAEPKAVLADLQAAPFEVDNKPAYLSQAWLLKPLGAEPFSGLIKHRLTFKTPGALFLIEHWKSTPDGPNWEAIGQREYHMKSGWINLGPCPWDKENLIWIKPIPIATELIVPLPPNMQHDWGEEHDVILAKIELLLVEDERYADATAIKDFGSAYEAGLLRHRASTLFQQKQWTELEKMFADLRKTRLRFANGQSGLDQAYSGAKSPFGATATSYRTGLDEYLKTVPGSAAAKLLQVNLMLRGAWQVRGEDLAIFLKPEAADAMTQMSRQTRPLLKELSASAASDPHLELLQVQTLSGANTKPAEIQRAVLSGLKKDPWQLPLIEVGAYYLLPRWFGESKSASDLAKQMEKEFKPESGPALYAAAALVISTVEPDQWDDQRGFDYKKMLTGLELLRQKFPEEVRYTTRACRAAAHRGDWETVDRLFPLVQDRFFASDLGGSDVSAELYAALRRQESSRVVWQISVMGEGWNALQIADEANRCYVASSGGKLRELDLKSGKVESLLSQSQSDPFGIAVLKNGNLALASFGGVQFYKNGKPSRRSPLRPALPLISARLSDDAKIAAGVTIDGEAYIINAEKGQVMHHVAKAFTAKRPGPFFEIALSPDGKTAAVAGFVDEVVVIDTATGKTRNLKSPNGFSRALAFHSDGKKLAAAGMSQKSKGILWEWDLNNGEIGWEFPMDVENFQVMTVSSDGNAWAMAASNGRGRVGNGYLTELYIFHKDRLDDGLSFVPEQRTWVSAMKWAADGERLAVIGRGGFARLFRFDDNAP